MHPPCRELPGPSSVSEQLDVARNNGTSEIVQLRCGLLASREALDTMQAALAAFKPHGCGLQRGREGDHYTRDGCLRQTCRYGLYEVGLRVMALLVVSSCALQNAAPCALFCIYEKPAYYARKGIRMTAPAEAP